jgi:hypothetical protein
MNLTSHLTRRSFISIMKNKDWDTRQWFRTLKRSCCTQYIEKENKDLKSRPTKN